ncbi:hypothetical protein [Chamaesiphon sp.]|uniref:plasmid mobilization protein n=1 Tax=Chamaesiphon sp. TaxID=2814140 RepID=UPI003593C2ED
MQEVDKRSNRVTIRLTDAERSTLRGNAEKLRLDESEYVRKMLGKGEIKQIVIPKVNQDTLQELVKLQIELNRQGINFNQLVKLLHSQQQVAPEIVSGVAALATVHKQTQVIVTTCHSQLIKLHDREN